MDAAHAASLAEPTPWKLRVLRLLGSGPRGWLRLSIRFFALRPHDLESWREADLERADVLLDGVPGRFAAQLAVAVAFVLTLPVAAILLLFVAAVSSLRLGEGVFDLANTAFAVWAIGGLVGVWALGRWALVGELPAAAVHELRENCGDADALQAAIECGRYPRLAAFLGER